MGGLEASWPEVEAENFQVQLLSSATEPKPKPSDQLAELISRRLAAMNYRSIIISGCGESALVACGGPEERKAKYRARAQEYLEAGNYPKARVALRNVLKIDPKDADAYFLFAQVEEKEKLAKRRLAVSWRWYSWFLIIPAR